jgi:DNA-binding IclR family transcriptional regulator
MTFSPEALISAGLLLATIIAWCVRMELRTSALAEQFALIEGQTRVILRGMVRHGLVTQAEVDEAEDQASDAHRRR